MDEVEMLGTLLAEPAPSTEAFDRSRRRLQDTMRGGVSRKQRRTGWLVGGLGLAAAGVAAAITISSLSAGSVRPPSPPEIRPVTLSADTTLLTDLGNTFPRHLVAAGHTAVAAYYTGRVKVGGDKSRTFKRTWYLYNTASGTYESTPWAYLDVAPGMHQAAVLEGPLPASRVGILDMNTQKVTRWIPVQHRVGGLSWSPDGHRLLLTSYSTSPDDIAAASGSGGRTGYYVADAGLGQAIYHALAADRNNPGPRQDLGWSRSGTLIWAPTATQPTKVFYDLSGIRHPAPAHEAETYDPEEAGLSPNGTLLPKFGPRPGPAVTVTDVKTGKKVAVLPIEQARAWADDSQLFAIGCDPKKCTGKGEFHNRLLLVNLNGRITPLTGYRRSDHSGSWVPVFTHR